MDVTPDLHEDEVEEAVTVSFRFAKALFDASDRIIIRPIETWIESGQKRSDVDYKRTAHVFPVSESWCVWLPQLLRAAHQDRLNLFFGVCPRFRPGGGFDLAWQIRTVKCLWADVDHVALEPTYERIEKAGLPPPSVVVNSGNGVHLYWRLDTPYLIDDVGDPPQVQTEWTEPRPGCKKPRRYIVENGDRVYLDQRRHLSRLSPKAEHVQDIVAGLAKVIGGDHTHDISRLLRIPGTLNRKDQRNGESPKPTELIECEPARRYTLASFEAFKSTSPETQRSKQIAMMPLPSPRSISTRKEDQLAELIAASAIAPAGTRSETDFAICCYAIRNSIGKEEVWSRVEMIGKFSEQGRRYFDLTWENAEHDARAATFEKVQKRSALKAPTCRQQLDSATDGGESEPPAEGAEDEHQPRRPTIVVDPQSMQVGETFRKVTDCLRATGNCFLRSEQLVVINDGRISTILSSPELAGLLNQHVEFYFTDDEAGEYKPLPAGYANTWLHQHEERGRLSPIKLFTQNPVYALDWRLVAPGYDADSGIYYAGPAVAPCDGTQHLDSLIRDFCFKSPGDRTNYLGVLLTALLVPRFIGCKPAALFNGNQPALGKTILAQIIAIARDGKTAETVSYNPNDEEFEKRLGAAVRRGGTTLIIDNAKVRGRSSTIDSPCLERSITDPVLSYRLLGYSDSIRAENSHTFCITANSAEVSRDLVTRSVVVNLHYEGNPEQRTYSIPDPEGYAQEHRLELLGELVGMVERWKASGMPLIKANSRFNKLGWANTVGGILHASGEPDFLVNAEEVATQLDEVKREFAELVEVLVGHPQGTWSASELVQLCHVHSLLLNHLGNGSIRSLDTKMGAIAGRFVEERFRCPDGTVAQFHKEKGRKQSLYRVSVPESAEP